MYHGVHRFLHNNLLSSLGVRFAKKLSCLEGFAALIGINALPNRIRNMEVLILVDNAVFVYPYANKHSCCPYAHTIEKALQNMACR